MGAPALALPALEVAVGRRGAALSGLEGVGVHAQAHRAAGTAPLGAGLLEDHVEPFVLGLQPDPHRTGYDEQAGVLVDLAALDDLGGEPQVLDPAVGAGADEDRVDLDLAHRRAGLEPHVPQCLLGGDPVLGVLEVLGARDVAPSGTPWPGLVPQVTNGVIVAGVEDDLLVELRVGVGAQGPPVLHRRVPLRALRRLGRPSM